MTADNIDAVIRTMAKDISGIAINQAANNALQQTMTKDIAEIKGDIQAQNGRLRSVESWRDKIIGAFKSIGIGGAVVTFVIGVLYAIKEFA